MVYEPMKWGIWTLTHVASLPIEACVDPMTSTDLITAVRSARPVLVYEGVLILLATRVDGVWGTSSEMAGVIKGLIHANPCLWLELADNDELGTDSGVVSCEPTPTSVRTPSLAGGAALEREKQRLEAEGHAELVPVLRRYAQLWQDYKIPVWKMPTEPRTRDVGKP